MGTAESSRAGVDRGEAAVSWGLGADFAEPTEERKLLWAAGRIRSDELKQSLREKKQEVRLEDADVLPALPTHIPSRFCLPFVGGCF